MYLMTKLVKFCLFQYRRGPNVIIRSRMTVLQHNKTIFTLYPYQNRVLAQEFNGSRFMTRTSKNRYSSGGC